MKKKTEEILLKRSRRLFKKKDLKILANKKAFINTTNKNNIFKEISKFHTQECNNKNNFPQKIICSNKKELDYLGKEDLNRYYYSNKINGSINNENSDINLNKKYKLINSQKSFRKYSMDKYKTRNNIGDIMNSIEYYIDKNGNPNSMKYFKSNNMKEKENKPIAYIIQGNKNKNALIDLKGNVIPKNKDGDYSISKDKILLIKNFDVQHPELRVYGEGKHKVSNNENDKSPNNICLNSPNFSPKLYFDYKRITNLLTNNNTIENNNFNLFRKKKVNAGNNNNNKINTQLTSPKNMSDKDMFGYKNYFSIQNNKKLINDEENNDDIPFKNNVNSFAINNVNRNNSNTLDNLYYNKTESNNFNNKLVTNKELNFKTNNKNILNKNDEYNQYSSSNIYHNSYNENNNNNNSNNNNAVYNNENKNNRNLKYPNEIYNETNLRKDRCSSAINIFYKKETNELSNTDKYNNYEKNNINSLKIDNIDENKIQKITYKPKKNHINRKIVKRKHHSFNKVYFNSQEQPTFSKILNPNDINEDIINYMKKDKYSRNENANNIKDIDFNTLRFFKQLIEEKQKIISDFHLNSLVEEKTINKNRQKRRSFCFNNNKTCRLSSSNNNKMYIKRNTIRNFEENKNVLNDEYNINSIINKYKNNSFLNRDQSKNQKLKNLLFTYERLFKRKNSDFQSKAFKNKNKYFNDDEKDDIDYKKCKNQRKKIKYLTPNSTKNRDSNNFILDKENTMNQMYTLNYDSTTRTNRTNKTNRTNDSNRRKFISCDEKNEFIFNITQSKTLLNNINYDNNLYNYTYRKIKSSIRNKCPDLETNTDVKKKSKKLFNTIDNNNYFDNFNKTYKRENLNINENYFKLLKNEEKESYHKNNLEESIINNKEKYTVNCSKEEKNKDFLKNIKKPIIINNQSYIYDNYGSDMKQNLNNKSRISNTRNNHIFNNKTINNCSFKHKNILRKNSITEDDNGKKEERKFSYDKENYNINGNNSNNLLLITNITKCPQCHCLFGQPTQLLQNKNNNE